MFNLLIPEAEDYYVPICIQIKGYEGSIVIGKNWKLSEKQIIAIL